MENRPPQQETPRRPPTDERRKTNGSGGSPTPPWLWLLLIGGFALIFWQFVPKNETPVTYYPWFYDQVETETSRASRSRATRSGANSARRMTTRIRRRQTKQKVRKFVTTLRKQSLCRHSEDHPDQ